MRDFIKYTKTWEKAVIACFLFMFIFGSCQIVDQVRDLQSKYQTVKSGFEKYQAYYEANKENIKGVLDRVTNGLDDVTAKIVALDKDNDGKISLNELLIGLGGSLGLMQSRNTISNRKKRDDKRAIWNAIDSIKSAA